MPDKQQVVHSDTSGRTTVWLVLTIGGVNGEAAAFWEQADAAAHADLINASDPRERSLLREVRVHGERRRCRLCGEPVVLDDPSEPMSWIHAADANDLGDHTAEW